jgi:hypothetical protein
VLEAPVNSAILKMAVGGSSETSVASFKRDHKSVHQNFEIASSYFYTWAGIAQSV